MGVRLRDRPTRVGFRERDIGYSLADTVKSQFARPSISRGGGEATTQANVLRARESESAPWEEEEDDEVESCGLEEERYCLSLPHSEMEMVRWI